MNRLYSHSIRHPKSTVVIGVLITLAIAPGTMRLRLRTDGHALVPTDAPEVRYDRSVRDEFQAEDQIVVLIHSDHAQGIYNTQTLHLVRDLTRRFGQIEHVRPDVDLFSLDTERSGRVKSGTLDFQPFLEPMPDTPQEIQRRRKDLREIELYTGTLVSYDEQATSILVSVPPGADRIELYTTIRDIVAGLGPTPEEIHVIGAPVAEALLGTHILEDLGVPRALLGQRITRLGEADAWRIPRSLDEFRLLIARHIGLVPIAIAVMMVVFVISFRSLPAALLPLMEVGACLVFVFGLMGWLGVPIYLTTAVLPIILTAIGVADEIHMLRTALTEMSTPVVKTSITTALGFCSFALSPLGPVRAFGLFTSVGIIFCMLWSLTVIPALLALVAPRRFVRLRRDRAAAGEIGRRPLFARLATAVVRYRYAVILLALIATVVAPLGLARVVIQDSWIDGFAPSSEFYQATQAFNDQFLGTHLLLVSVDTGHYVLSGEVGMDALDHHSATLPAELASDPQSLVGNQLLFRRIGEPARARRTQRRSKIPGEWRVRIETVVRQGDRIVVTWPRRGGSPLIVMAPPDGARFAYEITPQRLLSPETLGQIGELEKFIEARREDAVGGVLGTATYLATANFMSRGRREGTRCIPDSIQLVDQAWKRYKLARGQVRLDQAVDPDYARSLVTVFLKN
ncbi:MAG: efflux RND transporter permease subunit, partial [Planctomycetota bacterium]